MSKKQRIREILDMCCERVRCYTCDRWIYEPPPVGADDLDRDPLRFDANGKTHRHITPEIHTVLQKHEGAPKPFTVNGIELTAYELEEASKKIFTMGEDYIRRYQGSTLDEAKAGALPGDFVANGGAEMSIGGPGYSYTLDTAAICLWCGGSILIDGSIRVIDGSIRVSTHVMVNHRGRGHMLDIGALGPSRESALRAIGNVLIEQHAGESLVEFAKDKPNE